MGSDVSSAIVHLDAAGRIAQDVCCIQCGYNLRSLLPGQACPECNTDVFESIRLSRLCLASKAWLRRVIVGSTVLAVASAAEPVRTWGLFPLAYWLGGPALANLCGSYFRPITYLVTAGLTAGAMLVTSREPGRYRISARSRCRIAARTLLAGSFLMLMVNGVVGRPSPMTTYAQITMYVYLLLAAAGWPVLCLYLAQVAGRIPAVGLARLTRMAAVAIALIWAVACGTCLVSWFLTTASNMMIILHVWNVSHSLPFVPMCLLAVAYARELRRQRAASAAGGRQSRW